MYKNNPATIVQFLNMVGLIGICISLSIAFYYQIFKYELPCPLCLLQRVGLIISGFGFLFNLCFSIKNTHYGMMILGCILTGVMASRQVFLHIAPGDVGYGSALLGLHFYTWALITSVITIAAVAVLMAISDLHISSRSLSISPVLIRVAIWLFVLIIVANLMSTILECGGGQCADNPILYELLSR
ncbi:disulfide bond formation protein B [Enterobacteriaceae bacterium H11S18]|uniref:disulfide bond formation protein B n=1 Tax=Dryocola clanedunensis TaxID=2925396 RepID=UPI0022F07344|nr:disulfide bond formation protein B [Dryocola clanedunensis]MCT4708859.1 disulfide bond formation protein B [Dryocola clanedunensis]